MGNFLNIKPFYCCVGGFPNKKFQLKFSLLSNQFRSRGQKKPTAIFFGLLRFAHVHLFCASRAQNKCCLAISYADLKSQYHIGPLDGAMYYRNSCNRAIQWPNAVLQFFKSLFKYTFFFFLVNTEVFF